MSARIPPGFAEVWAQYNLSGDPDPMFVAIGIDLAVGVGASQAGTDALLIAVQATLDNIASSVYTIGPGHVIWGQDGGDLRLDGSGAPQAGGLAATALPNNNALLVRKLTAAGGRRGRGRMFIPGILEGDVGVTGDLAAAFRTTAQTQMDTLLSNVVATAEAEGCVLFHDSAPFTPTPITSLEVQPKIATQRRRMRR